MMKLILMNILKCLIIEIELTIISEPTPYHVQQPPPHFTQPVHAQLPDSLKGVWTVLAFKIGYDEWVSGGRLGD